MFYSETLLSKTGPLARVWLSANLERKLSKNHILQASVKDSVEAIVTPNQAPMALRLSGQLLLGVVRIYSRKARYLLDDCNEALMKIKMVRSFNLCVCLCSNMVYRHFAFQATTIYPLASTCHLVMLSCSLMCSLKVIT
jgi:Rad21/Rec8 like protein